MPVIANTIGPYNNPTETYPVCVIINLFTHYYISYFFNYHVCQFYSLPFCSTAGRQSAHKQDLGETLSGSHKVTTPYELTFLDPIPWRALCEEYLNAKELKQFKDAVEDDYFFEFLIDDLPLWGYIGEVSGVI